MSTAKLLYVSFFAVKGSCNGFDGWKRVHGGDPTSSPPCFVDDSKQKMLSALFLNRKVFAVRFPCLFLNARLENSNLKLLDDVRGRGKLQP